MIPFRRHFFVIPIIAIFVFLVGVGSASASSIQGFVFDQNRNALSEVDVELLNENRQFRQRDRTNGVGRYNFTDLADGRYYVKVQPFRYNLLDETKEVQIITFNVRGEGIGNTVEQVDFFLAPKKGGLGDTETGVIFAQEVPKEALELYKAARKALGDGDKQAYVSGLVDAFKAFPQYYVVLNELGKQLLVQKRYLEAASMFIRAVEINPKSSNSFYWMGVAFSQVGKDYYKSAMVAFGKAEVLAPAAYQIPFEMGKIEKNLGNFTAAEERLKKAKKLADNKADVSLLLAQLYSDDMKDYAKAADELETYLKESKSKDEALKAKVIELRTKAAAKQT